MHGMISQYLKWLLAWVAELRYLTSTWNDDPSAEPWDHNIFLLGLDRHRCLRGDTQFVADILSIAWA